MRMYVRRGAVGGRALEVSLGSGNKAFGQVRRSGEAGDWESTGRRGLMMRVVGAQ